jgi:hypothetical protein
LTKAPSQPRRRDDASHFRRALGLSVPEPLQVSQLDGPDARPINHRLRRL